MSSSKDVFERLVLQTVRGVLFSGSQHAVAARSVSEDGLSLAEEDNGAKKTSTAEIPFDTLLHQLIHSGEKRTESPEDEGDNNKDESCCAAWMKDCTSWSIERLKAEKTAIKRYIQAHRRKLSESGKKSSEIDPGLLEVHEVYALLKLFLLERDPDYRQCVQQSSLPFLKSLHAQLTLYATYFERAHGRQISAKVDVEPIQTLYEFFLAHQQ